FPQGRGAFAYRAHHGDDALAKWTDFRFDRDAATFLLVQRRTLALGVDAVGDVVMRADPVPAAEDGAVDDRNGTAVGRLDDVAHCAASLDRGQDLGAVLFRIEVETAGRDAILNEVSQRAAGLHDLRRQTIHLDVAVIADLYGLVRIDQHNALRHIIDDDVEQRAGLRAAAAQREQHETGAAERDENDEV